MLEGRQRKILLFFLIFVYEGRYGAFDRFSIGIVDELAFIGPGLLDFHLGLLKAFLCHRLLP